MQASTPSSFLRRAAALAAGIVLGLGAIVGCSSEGAATDCSLDECTVTFDRASVSLASVDDQHIAIRIGRNET
ncbi:MAG TPA: hypothetical protein VFX61_08285 [Micromonosporaceae bacterium]|nr:hypothetical protein [Micromonosporaceae bacterium]